MKKAHFNIVILLILTVLFITGCVSREVRQNQELMFNSTIPTCQSEKECEAKWSAARRWVLNNSSTKIQTMTDDFIETYNPRYSTDIAVRVSKEPVASGGYRFVVNVWCKNIFGCFPNTLDAANDFNNYVNSVSWTDSDEKEKTTETSGNDEDIEKKLEKLNILLKKGLITQDEYNEKRAKLLESF
jgi:Short C-terminal domain